MNSRSRWFLPALALALAASTLAGAAPDRARVWVEFAPGSEVAVGGALRQAGGQIHYRFDHLSAYAVTLPAAALPGFARNPNVVLIEDDPKRFPMAQSVPYGISMVQADLVSDANAGNRRVCIIDSGYSLGHADLPAGGNVSGAADGGAGSWFEDGDGHGTHVAGTIAALDNALGVIGVAPGNLLNLHIVRVFGDDGAWAYSSGLVAALDQCRTAGAQVVNMSLGGNIKSRTEERAFQQAYAAGVLSVAAAGNDGNTRHSYPASYPSVVSVAAVDADKLVADFSQQNNQVELAAPGVDVHSTFPTGQGSSSTLTVAGTGYDNAAMEGAPFASGSGALHDCGLATAACSAAAGRVCLIGRGEVAFADKVLNCQAGGGVAAIIYNNEPGMLYGTLGDVATSIPSVGTTQAIGQTLLGLLGAAAAVSIAPDDYATLSGTSMATPHVAGVAALVWSHFPDCSNDELRTALQATAEDLGPLGRDNAYGYGLVQARAAFDLLTLQGCSGGGGGEPPSCPLLPTGAPCASDSDCCSGRCKGKPGAKTCG
ncbi:MAG: S8 family serine peptidase [Pseudomonadota bacterium]